ncbi:MAG: hypothetical protein RH859_09390 [Longimicrobiales bacterium]
MKYFCDRLSTEVVRAVLEAGVDEVTVLEEGRAGDLRHERRLGRAGVVIHRPDFFAGHLRTPDGESLYTAAVRMAGPLALKQARDFVSRSTALSAASEHEGRETVALHVARQLQFRIAYLLLRVLSARSLSDGAPCVVLLARPEVVDLGACVEAVPGVDLRLYSQRWATAKSWSSFARDLAREVLRRSVAWMGGLRRGVERSHGSTVLLVEEDELHADRSIRGQPHWLAPEDAAPPFRTLVLRRGRRPHGERPSAALERLGVEFLGLWDLGGARRRQRRAEATIRMRRQARDCLREMLTISDSASRRVLLWGWRLLLRSEEMAALACDQRVRTFVSGEPYQLEPDAVQLAARETGMKTLAFQYSNLIFASPLMLSTADRFLVFSRAFEPLWSVDGFRPRRFEATGYVFDGAQERVRPRSEALRAKLEAHGARYVLCYFDESVQTDRWGLFSAEDHRSEFLELARFVLDDPSVGLVVKTQFRRNSPSQRYADESLFERLQATGRYCELLTGEHRNIVFPIEGSLAADLSIGHLAGATAALEAAVAGGRAVLINAYGVETLHDQEYARGRIVFPSLGAVLEAVREERENESEGSLGDWSPIVDRFDPFLDGRAAARMRAVIESMTVPEASAR